MKNNIWKSVEDDGPPPYGMVNVIVCDEIGDIWFDELWDFDYTNKTFRVYGKGKYKITHWMQIVAPEVKDD